MWKGREQAPTLTDWFGRTGMTFVDVGGRGDAFLPLRSLAPFAHYFVSEPDAVEAARLAQSLRARDPWRTVTVISEAMGTQVGHAQLRITAEPGMSSLLEPDPDVVSRFCLEHKFAVVRTESVPLTTLDDAAVRCGFRDACFLKIDTQGTELDILRSGASLVEGPLLGVHVETNFHGFYQGQSLFSDVDQHLRARGFTLFSLSRTALRRSGYQPHVFSKRVTAWAHCLYLREPQSMLALDREAQSTCTPRLLALSLAFRYFDVAFEIAEIAKRLSLVPAQEVERLPLEIAALAETYLQRTVSRAERTEPESLTSQMLSPSARDRKRWDE